MEKIIEKIFNGSDEDFINNGECFLSEKDFQFNFARMLEKNNCKNVILEYPIEKENYNNSDNFKGRNAYIDIYCEYNNKQYYIELKYKTKKLRTKRYNLKTVFELKNHYAHNDNVSLIKKDICRLEQIVKKENKRNCIGYVLLLTNDNYYEKNHTSITNNYCKATWKNFKNHSDFKYLLIKITNNKE